MGLWLDPPWNFSLPPTGYCCTSADGTLLAAQYDTGASHPREHVRVRVGPSFDFVFGDGRLVGWLLEQPERFLVTGWEPAAESPPNPELAALLRDFLPYLAEPLIDRITDDTDPHVLTELRALEGSARRLAAHGGRAKVLADAVRELIDDWY